MGSSETPEIPKLNLEEDENEDVEAPKVDKTPQVPPIEITDLEDDHQSAKSAKPNGLLLLPSQLSGNRTWRPETSRFFKGEIPKPFVYHKPNKDERLEGKQNLQAMDVSRASRLTKRLLIICALVTGVIVVTIAAVVAVVLSTPDQVEESEGSFRVLDTRCLKSQKKSHSKCHKNLPCRDF